MREWNSKKMGGRGGSRYAASMAALLASLLSACVAGPLAGNPATSPAATVSLPSVPAVPGANAAIHEVGKLRFIGEQRLAWKQHFAGTTVGGLSGLDYDPATGMWVLESDDRSAIDPARFYMARLDYDASAFKSVTLAAAVYFRQGDGSQYPGANSHVDGHKEIPDIETIRFDPQDGSLWYASEGDRNLGLDPFVRHAARDGSLLTELPVPAMFKMSPSQQRGPRNNMSFEGLSFAVDGETLWLGMEAPLYQDGPLASPDAGAVVRISHLSRAGTLLGQFAYPLEPIAGVPAPGKSADNGVSEILAIGPDRLFALERAGIEAEDGSYRNVIRLYEMDVSGATDVSAIDSLQGASYVPAKKRLVLDLTTLALPKLDNVEGIAWGPRLANGHDTLVLMSDDNFNRSEVTQFLLFEVLPRE
jgi:hypothetical protein